MDMDKADQGDLIHRPQVSTASSKGEGSKQSSKSKIPVAIGSSKSVKADNVNAVDDQKSSQFPLNPDSSISFAKSEILLGEKETCGCCKSKSSPSPLCIPPLAGNNHVKPDQEDLRTCQNAYGDEPLYTDSDQEAIRTIRAFQMQYPRIKKSLLYSNSPDFAEYEKSLLKLSSICAPNTIYFVHDLTENIYRGKFSLYCKSQCRRCAFKVKSSSSKAVYAVSPHRGFLSPGEEIKVMVEVRPKGKAGDTPDVSPSIPNIFKHAALGIFTATIDNSKYSYNTDIASFWEHFERETPECIAGHFIKRFFVLQPNGDIHFPSCIHNIMKSISPTIKSNGGIFNQGVTGGKGQSPCGYGDQDSGDQFQALHLYNCALLEKLMANSKITDCTFTLQILIFLAIFIPIVAAVFGYVF